MGFAWSIGLFAPILPAVIVWLIATYCRYIRVILLSVIELILLVELFVVLFNHTPFSANVLSLIAETDQRETVGFMKSILSSSALYIALGIFFSVTIAMVGVVKIIIHFTKQNSIFKYGGYILLIPILVSCLFVSHSFYTLYYRFNDPDLLYFISHRDDPPEYYTTATRLLGGMAYVYSSNANIGKIKERLLEAEIISHTNDSPLIILVIGESYNKHHTPLYEPSYKNTTPNLCALRDSGNLVVYIDVVAPFNHTNAVLHTMFSMCTVEDWHNWMNYPLFPVLFRKAGYNVVFLSNQFAAQYDDVWNQFNGGIFNKKELSELQYTYHNRQVYPFDGELLEELPSDSILDSVPHLILFHLIGQHVNYKDRCPDSCRVFTANDYQVAYSDNEKQMIADYDNSLRYNDIVIHNLVDKIKDKDAVIIYMADHGEECYDWRNQYMRTEEEDMPREAAKYQFEVPFFVYLSPLYQQNHPEHCNSIRKAASKPLYNTDVASILLHLAGIQSVYSNTRNALSDDYWGEQNRIINEHTNYDLLMKHD